MIRLSLFATGCGVLEMLDLQPVELSLGEHAAMTQNKPPILLEDVLRADAKRFWSKVEKTQASGCWIWSGKKNRRGRGSYAPRTYKGAPVNSANRTEQAHIYAWILMHGARPEGQLMFICGNEGVGCVNPDHMKSKKNMVEIRAQVPLKVREAFRARAKLQNISIGRLVASLMSEVEELREEFDRTFKMWRDTSFNEAQEVKRLRAAIKEHRKDKTAPGPTSVNSDDRKLWKVLDAI